MTKEETLHKFFSMFGLPAYDETTVYNEDKQEPKLPYITYENITDSLGHNVLITCSLWYRNASWKPINEKTQEIETFIGRGGVVLPCDNGAIWIKKGTPFAQNMTDTDIFIKRKLINLSVEFLTEN